MFLSPVTAITFASPPSFPPAPPAPLHSLPALRDFPAETIRMQTQCERRPRRLAGGPWLTAVEHLCSAPPRGPGYSDRRVAELLWDLSDDAIRSLGAGRWHARAVERLLVPGSGDTTWTAPAVRHHRRQLGIPPNRMTARSEHYLPRLARERRLAHQEGTGWAHLLPRHELTPLECDVLSALRDRGPLTRRQLLLALGKQGERWPFQWRGGPLGRLRACGLVVVAGRSPVSVYTPGRPLYAVGAPALAGVTA